LPKGLPALLYSGERMEKLTPTTVLFMRSILPVGMERISCLAQGCSCSRLPAAAGIGSAGLLAGCHVDLPVHAALRTNRKNAPFPHPPASVSRCGRAAIDEQNAILRPILPSSLQNRRPQRQVFVVAVTMGRNTTNPRAEALISIAAATPFHSA